jgi:hypothetical protein
MMTGSLNWLAALIPRLATVPYTVTSQSTGAVLVSTRERGCGERGGIAPGSDASTI